MVQNADPAAAFLPGGVCANREMPTTMPTKVKTRERVRKRDSFDRCEERKTDLLARIGFSIVPVKRETGNTQTQEKKGSRRFTETHLKVVVRMFSGIDGSNHLCHLIARHVFEQTV